MKKELTPTTTKGELLQDEQFVIQMGKIRVASELDGDEYSRNILDKDDRFIAQVTAVPYYSYDQAEQMAKYFCQAVNERQRLLDSNRELLKNLKVAKKEMERQGYFGEVMENINAAINNAKNLQP